MAGAFVVLWVFLKGGFEKSRCFLVVFCGELMVDCGRETIDLRFLWLLDCELKRDGVGGASGGICRGDCDGL